MRVIAPLNTCLNTRWLEAECNVYRQAVHYALDISINT